MQETAPDVKNPEVPLVTAVMLAGRLPQWAVQGAVDCFAAQTYPNRELVIVSNHRDQLEASGFRPRLPRDADGRELAIILDTPRPMSAGMCRNYGMSVANGDVIVQFDSHCWHSPDRIAEQVAALLKHQSQVCMLLQGIDYSFASGYAGLWATTKNCVLNSMAFWRAAAEDYRDADKAEELSLLNRMISGGARPITVDRPGSLVRLHYGGEVREPINCGGKHSVPVEQMGLLKRVVSEWPLG